MTKYAVGQGGGAIFSDCGAYRYLLTRHWNDALPSCLFIMLNPSTADATLDDHTVRKCRGFATRWGCGRFSVVNLFAFRTSSVAVLKTARDPVGPENDMYIRQQLADNPKYVVAAWGVNGAYRQRSEEVLRLLRGCDVTLYCISSTKGGYPQHPLMAAYAGDRPLFYR